LSETFDTIVVTIRERIKVENKIAALTAQRITAPISHCKKCEEDHYVC
jgi:hypothetical protein